MEIKNFFLIFALMGKKRIYYHATPSRLKKGDRISASSSAIKGKNFSISGFWIYMTTSPYIHFTMCSLLEKGKVEKLYVYEVEPINKKKVYRGIWDEWITREVEVVKRIGHITEIGKGLARFESGSLKTRTGYQTFLIDKTKDIQYMKVLD